MTQKEERALTAVQQNVIDLLAHSLFQAEYIPDPETDWEKVLTEAEQQAVFPLVFPDAESYLAPELLQTKQTLFYKHLYLNLNSVHAHGEAHRLLTQADIPYVVLKGCASASYYPEPELRTMGDVDLYVDRANMPRVRSVMEAEGFRATGLSHPHHWTFLREGEEVEVHWVPSGIPSADDGTILSCFSDLLSRSQTVTEHGQTLVLPDPYHHGLVLLLHTVNHLTAGGIGLRHLLDWLVFCSGMPEETFLATFEDTLRSIKLWQFTRVFTSIGVNFFSCPARDFCKDVDPQLALSLLLDILAGGNFGHKDQNRLNQSKLLRDNQTRRIDGKSSFRHAMGFLNQRAKAAYPAAQKMPLLLPVGWFKVLTRWRRGIQRGTHPKLHVNEMLIGAKERQSTYEQLRIFEQ